MSFSMNKFRLSILAFSIVALVLATQFSFAKNTHHMPKGPKELIELLSLDDSQQVSFQEIMHEQHEQMMMIKVQNQSARAKQHHLIRAEKEQLREETVARLSAILTVAQIEVFEEFMEQKEQGHRCRRGHIHH